jgi:methyltransferase (TIGR00027 family)
MPDETIQHISDTSLWIAAYRAQETDRLNAVINDPFAKQLAGERGYKMLETTPHTKAMAFAMVIRTLAIDRLIFSAIDKGIDTVINLGAGLDTRPYRLQLPPQLKWIEVDFKNIIDYKTKILADEKPVCYLQRIAADLSQELNRKELLSQLGMSTQKALVVTEGVIGYLTNKQAASLSKDIFSVPTFRYWIMEYAQGKLRKRRQTKDLSKKLKNTPIQFDCNDPVSFFKELGWKVCETRFILDEADSVGKKLPLMFPWSLLLKLFPKKIRELCNKTYGYVTFCK